MRVLQVEQVEQLASALGAPELSARGPQAAGELGAVGGAAYRLPSGPIYFCWPGGGRGTYTGPEDCAPMIKVRHELVAAGLTAEDCEAVCEQWSRAGQRGRAAVVRQLLAEGLAPLRARARAKLLRDLRRGLPPCGSLSSAHRPGRDAPWPLVRFPDGRGWWGESGWLNPWTWPRGGVYCGIPQLLAAGLSEEDCKALAGEEALEGAVRVLRERGLA